MKNEEWGTSEFFILHSESLIPVRSLITGVGGFAGQYLATRLLQAGDQVSGVARRNVRWHIVGAPESSAFTLLSADLCSRDEAFRVIESAAPDRVYHLAAASSVPESFADPVGTLHNNITALVHTLEAVRARAPTARVLVVSSSEIYGRPTREEAIDEKAELRPENPYAVSKAAEDLLGYQYHAAYEMDVVRVRPFNHIGPGQTDRFVTANLARQIAEIEIGSRDPVLQVGNLAARRDFTDVRDVVRAYELALLRGEAGAVYNIGSGVGVSIQSLLDTLVARSRVPITVEVDPSRLRRTDSPTMVCNATRFRKATGWRPELSLERTLEDILDYWRRQVHEP
jgi:GDP-4-dehydro-6-deoxy-D-mannose reductase